MYFFLHIPKSAGTSVKTTIAENSKKIAHKDILDISNRETSDLILDRNNKKLVVGHYGVDFIQQHFRQGDKKLTFLRSPESRLLSMYNYWSSGQASTSSSKSSEGLSLVEFLKCENTSRLEQIDNIQTWLIASDYRFSQRERLKSLKPWELLSLAKFNLMQFDFIGFQEYYDSSMLRLGNILDFEYKKTSPINETKLKNVIICDESRSLIKPFIYLDNELYAFALRLAKERGWLSNPTKK